MSARIEPIEAVVETPAGSRNKYRYDEKTRRFQLHKGRKFEIRERRGPKVARKLIEKSRKAARMRSRKGR